MAVSNLIIQYDLVNPGQNYDSVIAAIKELGGPWAKPLFSCFYVASEHSAASAAKHVWRVMDANDKLLVVDATYNTASWFNLPDAVATQIQRHWASKQAA